MNAKVSSPRTAATQRRASERKLDPDVVDDLVAAYRTLANLNVLDAFGHVSVRDPRNPNRYLMSRSIAPEAVTAADILVLDLDSQIVDRKDEGTLLYRERFIHGEIYKVRPDVNAVVHSHSPTVVPFTVTRAKLRPILHNAGFLGYGAPLFEIRKCAGNATDLLVETPALGKALARSLGKNAAVVLMRGHGNSVVGPTLARRGVPRLLHRGQCPPAAAGHHHRRADQLPHQGGGDHQQRSHAARRRPAMGALASQGAGGALSGAAEDSPMKRTARSSDRSRLAGRSDDRAQGRSGRRLLPRQDHPHVHRLRTGRRLRHLRPARRRVPAAAHSWQPGDPAAEHAGRRQLRRRQVHGRGGAEGRHRARQPGADARARQRGRQLDQARRRQVPLSRPPHHQYRRRRGAARHRHPDVRGRPPKAIYDRRLRRRLDYGAVPVVAQRLWRRQVQDRARLQGHQRNFAGDGAA